MRSWGNIQAR